MPNASPSTARRRLYFRCALITLALLLSSCTPPAAPRPRVAASPALSAATYTTTDGLQLAVRRWPAAAPTRAIVVALHGFNDYSQSFDEVARHFASAGVSTLAYDQRGFGSSPDRERWPGTAALTADLLDLLPLVRAEHPALPLYVMGESMGGAVAAIALARTDSPGVAGTILLTPAVWSRQTMPWYQRFGIWIGALITPAVTLSGAAFAISPSDNPEVRQRQQTDPLVIKATRLDRLSGLSDLMDEAPSAIRALRQPTLILYGLRDVMMPRRPMIGLHQDWPEGDADHFRFALYPEGHHTLLRDRQRQVVWNDVLSWLLHPEAALPSGFEHRRQEVLPRLRTAP